MNRERFYRFNWIAPALILALIISGCASKTAEPTITSSPGPTTTPSPIPTTISPTSVATETTTDHVNVVDSSALYHDDFTNPASGWPEEKFDNYFIGYHEPEYYHVEVSSPNYKTTVIEPEKKGFGDVTI